jgi:LasA protease
VPQSSVRRDHTRRRLPIAILSVVFVLASGPAGGSSPVAQGAAAEAVRAELAQEFGFGPSERYLVTRFAAAGAWETGTLVIPGGSPDGAAHDADPRVFLYLARRGPSGWTAALEGTRAFERLAALGMASLVDTRAGALLATATATYAGGSAALRLPWPTGTSRRLTGGPHSFSGSRYRPWSSLDFAAPISGQSVRISAARGGLVVRPCANLVQIRHGEGWTTSYYHVKNVAVRKGQYVARGALIGYTSKAAGCGGYATGPHVHFSLLRSGSYVNIRGHTIGGWTVRDGSSPYSGCMVKGSVIRCAPNGLIYNDGSVGSR